MAVIKSRVSTIVTHRSLKIGHYPDFCAVAFLALMQTIRRLVGFAVQCTAVC